MSTDRIKILTAGIKNHLKPTLVSHGFSLDASSRTFRKNVEAVTQIVNVQVGVRSMEGMFTINLGVYHPEYRADAYFSPSSSQPLEHSCVLRERLSSLRDTPITSLFRSHIQSTNSFWKWWLVTPSDKWWSFSAEESLVASSLHSVERLLLTKGFDWLAQNSDVSLLAAKFAMLKQPRDAAQQDIRG